MRAAYGLAVLDFDSYLERLASAEPTPGGGSAAALTGAMSAALIAMVARITLGSAKHAAVHDEARTLTLEGDRLRAAFTAARAIDETAYRAVVDAMALPRSTDAEKSGRTARLQQALAGAAEAPLGVAGQALQTLGLCERAAALRNPHLMSDVDCALRLARAALDASAANVEVNHRFLKNAEAVALQSQRLAAIRVSASEIEARVLAAL
ncbi:MAG: cyclodeaminase/cyclohydrolase family protein [Candidatus Velthaea sp.]